MIQVRVNSEGWAWLCRYSSWTSRRSFGWFPCLSVVASLAASHNRQTSILLVAHWLVADLADFDFPKIVDPKSWAALACAGCGRSGAFICVVGLAESVWSSIFLEACGFPLIDSVWSFACLICTHQFVVVSDTLMETCRMTCVSGNYLYPTIVICNFCIF